MTDYITNLGGTSVHLADTLGLTQWTAAYAGETQVQSAGDEIGPVQWVDGGAYVYRGGNHGALCWSQAGSPLTTADIGLVWAQGANRITLLNVDGGAAIWSTVHNAAVTAQASSSAPSGTWTGTSEVAFDSAPASVQVRDWDAVAQSSSHWETGRHESISRTYVQALPSWMDVVLAAQRLRRAVTPIDVAPTVTLDTTWTWPGDQPGVTLVDVVMTWHKAGTVSSFGGLQMARASGESPEVAFVGMSPGHARVGWASDSTLTQALAADWAGGVPPSAMMTRSVGVGGVAIGLFSSSTDRSTLASVGFSSTIGKCYLTSVDQRSPMAAGSVVMVHGWRSVTAEASDRHVHVATGPDGVTRFWLMAGSTGRAEVGALYYHRGRVATVTRGTAVVGDITEAGLDVTGAGWAEGTITGPGGIVTHA